MKYRILMLFAIACLVAPSAHAGTGFVGASAGQSSVNVGDSIGGGDFDADDMGWKAFGGYDFVRYFGLEGDYTDMGSLEASGAGTDVSSDISGFGVFARGIIPLGKRVELFGKLGLVLWEADTRVSSPLLTVEASDSGNDLAFGAGAAFLLTQKFSIRVEYEVFDIEETDDVNFGSIGFSYRF